MQKAYENSSMVWCFQKQKQKPETGNTEAAII